MVGGVDGVTEIEHDLFEFGSFLRVLDGGLDGGNTETDDDVHMVNYAPLWYNRYLWSKENVNAEKLTS